MYDLPSMATRGFVIRKKSKKKQLSDYNFYLTEASSSDSVDTEYSVSGVEDGKMGDEACLNGSSCDEEEEKEKETDYFPPSIEDHNSVVSSSSSSLLLPGNSIRNSSLEEGIDTDTGDGDVIRQTIHDENSSNNDYYSIMTHTSTTGAAQEDFEGTLECGHRLKSPGNEVNQNEANGLHENKVKEELEKEEGVEIIKKEKTNSKQQQQQHKSTQKEKKNMDLVNGVIMEEDNSHSDEQVFLLNGTRQTNTVVLLEKENIEKTKSKNMSEAMHHHYQQQQQQTSIGNSESVETPITLSSVDTDENIQKVIDEENGRSDRHAKNPATRFVNNVQTAHKNNSQQEGRSAEHSSKDIDSNVYKDTNSKQKNELRGVGVSHSILLESNLHATTPIRADQFNKICPSPFDDVPGFRRSCSTSYRRESKREREVLVSPKLSKSSSLDTAAATMLLSPVVVGRDKWIRFEDHEQLQDSHTAALEQNHRTPDKITKSSTHDSSLCQRHEWISFGATTNNTKTKQTLTENEIISDTTGGCHSDDADDDQDLILKTVEESEGRKLRKDKFLLSTENVVNTMNKTISYLKGPTVEQAADQEALVGKCAETSSQLSDEVISLESDTDEEKLRDTPVKQFPDVSLFQAKVVTKNNSDNSGRKDNDDNNDDDTKVIANKEIVADTFAETLHEYPPPISPTSWKFWYRYPDRKKRLRSRKWLPVTIKIEGDFLQINGSSDSMTEMIKEIPLHPFYVFTVPVLHKGNKDGNVHSVKLQYVKYKEKRGIRARFGIEHVPIYMPVVKLSSRDVIALREFISHVESLIRHIPTHRDKGVTYSHEEIFIDSEDQCHYLIAGDGRILKYNVTVQLRLRVFVTGNPELKLFLNDFNNKEILSRTKEALLHDEIRKPTSNWISPELYEYHPCVDPTKSVKEGGVVFVPPDGCSFELLRFRVRKCNPLPLISTSSIEVLATNTVHLKADVRVNGDAKSIRHKRTGVVLYIPVPPSWSKLFLKPTNFRRKSKTYISVKSNDKLSQYAKVSNSRVTLTVSIGTATYEPAYGSIVWKIGMLPVSRDRVPVDVLHSFECLLELPFPLHIREEFQPYSYLEYNVAYQIGSDVSVEEILVSDGRVPEKWVCYRSSYMHKMEMKIWEDGKLRKCS